MRCANFNCRAMADQLLMGTLTLVEFETAPDDRISHASGGFPIYVTRTKYFWLCETCSRLFKIRRWNASGLILERQNTDGFQLPESQASRKPSAVSIEPEFTGSLYGAA